MNRRSELLDPAVVNAGGGRDPVPRPPDLPPLPPIEPEPEPLPPPGPL